MSPFSALTLRQYSGMSLLCLVGGGFFLAAGGGDFQGGVNTGLGIALLVVAITFVVLCGYVRKRLNEPLEFWRDQQRRLGGRVWGATAAVTVSGVLFLLLALLDGHLWLAGCAAGVTALPALLIVGKLTGQIGTY